MVLISLRRCAERVDIYIYICFHDELYDNEVEVSNLQGQSLAVTVNSHLVPCGFLWTVKWVAYFVYDVLIYSMGQHSVVTPHTARVHMLPKTHSRQARTSPRVQGHTPHMRGVSGACLDHCKMRNTAYHFGVRTN